MSRVRLRTVLSALVVGAFGLSTVLAPSASAATAPSPWTTAGYDTGFSYWDSQEVTITPARAKTLALNFSIPQAVDPNPDSECLNAVGSVEAAGRLYDVGPDGISAYNQWSGARLWNLPTPNYLYYTARLQIVGSDLIVVFRDCISSTNANSSVFVINSLTGLLDHPVWSPLNAAGTATVIDGVFVAIETNDDTSQVVGYDLAGSQLWTTSSDWGGRPRHVIGSKGLVYVQDSAGILTALRVATGATVWRSFNVVAGALSQDGTDLYAVDPFGTGLYDIDPATGLTRNWVGVPGRGSTLMAVDATTIYTSCAGTALCATRRSTGQTLWTVNAGGSGQPVVAGGVVYFNGRAFRTTTGKRIKSSADGTQVTSVAGGRVYGLVGTTVVSYK